jgi:excisionase family DNA binding protein
MKKLKAWKVKEVALQLGISEQGVRDLITSNELQAYRVGVGRGRIIIRTEDLLAYQRQQQPYHNQ